MHSSASQLQCTRAGSLKPPLILLQCLLPARSSGWHLHTLAPLSRGIGRKQSVIENRIHLQIKAHNGHNCKLCSVLIRFHMTVEITTLLSLLTSGYSQSVYCFLSQKCAMWQGRYKNCWGYLSCKSSKYAWITCKVINVVNLSHQCNY